MARLRTNLAVQHRQTITHAFDDQTDIKRQRHKAKREDKSDRHPQKCNQSHKPVPEQTSEIPHAPTCGFTRGWFAIRPNGSISLKDRAIQARRLFSFPGKFGEGGDNLVGFHACATDTHDWYENMLTMLLAGRAAEFWASGRQ